MTQTADLSASVSAAVSALVTSVYLTIDQAQAYFDTILYTSDWDNASSGDKNKALTMATRAIDSLRYIGDRTEGAITSGNQFPRGTDTTVPQAVLDAVCEEALAILDGNPINEDFADLRVVSERMSGVTTSYDSHNQPMHTLSGLKSRKAYTLIQPWLIDHKSFRMQRVS